MPEQQKKKTLSFRPLPIAIGVSVGVIVILIFLLWFDSAYAGKIYPGVKIGELDVGGQTPRDVLELLDRRTTDVLDDGLQFVINGSTVTIPTTIASEDFTYDILTFDHNASVAEAYAFGREYDSWTNIQQRISAKLGGYVVAPSHTFDQQELLSIFTEHVTEYETPKVNAELIVTEDESLDILPEQQGETFDRETVVSSVMNQIFAFSFNPVKLELTVDTPNITEAEASPLLPQARGIATRAPLAATYGEDVWEISETEVRTWLAFVEGDDGIELGLRSDHINETLDRIGTAVNVPAKNGKFSIADGKVTEFQNAEDGREIDRDANFRALDTLLFDTTDTVMELVVNTLPAEASGDLHPEEFGIVELLGTGHTNFRGSPSNRIHNIHNGANILNGLLVKPGEEFSLVKALLPFELDHGWKEELVIKGDRTIPEIGGGGCQLGTTTFRAAMNSALPITARRAHSYIVSYYYDENGKPGKDATIYDPAPDFRFTNDTGHYILIQTRIEGYDFYMDFWGTKDGRVQEQTSTVVSDWTEPEPPRTIKTTDLAPGVREKVESAHKGATTTFDYIITYTDGTKDETTFKSKYKAWQEAWLEGVTQEELDAENAKEETVDE